MILPCTAFNDRPYREAAERPMSPLKLVLPAVLPRAASWHDDGAGHDGAALLAPADRSARRDSHRIAQAGSPTPVVDVGRSLSQDRKRKAEHASKPGHGDRATGRV